MSPTTLVRRAVPNETGSTATAGSEMRTLRTLALRVGVAAAVTLVPVAIQAQERPVETPPPADSVKAREVVKVPAIEVIGRREGAVLRQTGAVHILSRENIEILRPVSTDD